SVGNPRDRSTRQSGSAPAIPPPIVDPLLTSGIRSASRRHVLPQGGEQMTKADLIQSVAALGMTKKAAGEMVDSLFGTISKTIKKDGRFSYPGFGTWTVRQRKARMGRNPQTGAEIKIKASKTVGFKPAKELKGGL